MKFIDIAHISVKAGDGGQGMSHFRREKHVSMGGPDGGHGGPGGNVFIKADEGLTTLLDFRYQRHHTAEDGGKGGTNNRQGHTGSDLILRVPCGTVAMDTDTQEILGEVLQHNDMLCVAKGGKGGIGNHVFATSHNQAPTKTKPPEMGERKTIQLELKMIADVGIIGAPNAGKSTLIAVISAARPKVADYAFTTLVPNLGVVSHKDAHPFVVADVPGLIPGASEGKGLGFEFLRHIERTKVLIHLVDASQEKADLMTQDFEGILNELRLYNADLLKRPRITVLSKLDETPPQNVEALTEFKNYLKQMNIMHLEISSATRMGIESLLDYVVKMVGEVGK